MLKNFFVNLNLEVKLLKKKFIFNGLGEPSNKLFAVKYDNFNINYSGKSAKIVQNSNYDSNSSPRFGWRKDGITTTITWIYFNKISALIYMITKYILIELAHIYMVSQN